MRLSCPNCKRVVVLSDKYTGDRDICPQCFTPIELDPSKKFKTDMLKWNDAFAQKDDKKDDKTGK
jgi:Zn-finger nucleic acid-binding protein